MQSFLSDLFLTHGVPSSVGTSTTRFGRSEWEDYIRGLFSSDQLYSGRNPDRVSAAGTDHSDTNQHCV